MEKKSNELEQLFAYLGLLGVSGLILLSPLIFIRGSIVLIEWLKHATVAR